MSRNSAWPDVKGLMCSGSGLDEVLGSMEDFKQGSDVFVVCILKDPLWQQ